MSSQDDPRRELLELAGAVRGHLETLKMMDVSLPSKNEVGGKYEWPEAPVIEKSKARQLEKLFHEMDDCHICPYARTRTNIVFGDGNPEAKLMFVGEAPGADEDQQGLPFVGRSGKLLTKIIEAMGLKREDIYIGNILKCRPPGNQTPTQNDRVTCGPYLARQIEIIQPQVIVTLGAVSTQYLLETKESMGRMRGHFQDYKGIKVMPTYHPAYLLRSYTKENRRKVWDDMQKVMEEIGLKKKK